MAYTEYKYDNDTIAALAETRAANLRANRGFSSLLTFGLSVIAQRLQQDPRRYRDYGPWWPALKEVMNRNGYNLGQQSDPIIARAYRFDADVQTLVAADEFRTAYLKTHIVYTNQFLLDAGSAEFWTLFDEDMEFAAAR